MNIFKDQHINIKEKINFMSANHFFLINFIPFKVALYRSQKTLID